MACGRIVSFEEAAEGENYELINPNTVRFHNPFGSMDHQRGESVPCKTIQAFGSYSQDAEGHHSGYHFVGAQNLYRTKKELGYMYPDLVIQFWNSPRYQELIRNFPSLKEKNSILDRIEYHPFEVHGYSVIICPETWAKKRAEEYAKLSPKYPVPTYYFSIPELKVRSPSLEWLKKQKISDNGLFLTIQEALAAAEKYIEYL